MKLSDLKTASALLKITTLSKAIGYQRTTLDTRIRRGAPELTEADVAKIEAALAEYGISIKKQRKR